MEEDLGREQAHRLVWQALGDQVRESIRTTTPSGGSRDSQEWLLRFSQAGDALDLDRLDGGADEINLNVTRWAYAEFFDQLDEPELDFLLVCSLDYDFADGAGVTLERSRTLM
jgi:hypothetical protein